MIKYPSVRYHRDKQRVIVNSPEEDVALGEGWADTPAAFFTPEQKQVAEETSEIPLSAEARRIRELEAQLRQLTQTAAEAIAPQAAAEQPTPAAAPKQTSKAGK